MAEIQYWMKKQKGEIRGLCVKEMLWLWFHEENQSIVGASSHFSQFLSKKQSTKCLESPSTGVLGGEIP